MSPNPERTAEEGPDDAPLTPEARFTHHEYASGRAPGQLRRLPSLVLTAIRVVWAAAPRQLAATALLQLVIAAGLAAQLFVRP